MNIPRYIIIGTGVCEKLVNRPRLPYPSHLSNKKAEEKDSIITSSKIYASFPLHLTLKILRAREVVPHIGANMMCRISPEHVPMLRAFGAIMLVIGIGSLVIKKTYFKRVILKEMAPLDYWVSVSCYLLLGSVIEISLLICR